MAILPNIDDLDDMAQLIGGSEVRFVDLGPEARIQIVQLVNQGDIVEKLEELDKSLAPIVEWFSRSDNFDIWRIAGK